MTQSHAAVTERQTARLLAMYQRIARLRGTGPNPFDYWIWADETHAVIKMIFGNDSEEARTFSELVDTRGRTPDQRGQQDNMTLNLHGDWGIWARLDRVERMLAPVLRSMGADVPDPHPAPHH